MWDVKGKRNLCEEIVSRSVRADDRRRGAGTSRWRAARRGTGRPCSRRRRRARWYRRLGRRLLVDANFDPAAKRALRSGLRQRTGEAAAALTKRLIGALGVGGDAMHRYAKGEPIMERALDRKIVHDVRAMRRRMAVALQEQRVDIHLKLVIPLRITDVLRR